jgi:hypothetical protein
MEMLWLAAHHFDGICAYVDPVTFAAALAAVPSAPGAASVRVWAIMSPGGGPAGGARVASGG